MTSYVVSRTGREYRIDESYPVKIVVRGDNRDSNTRWKIWARHSDAVGIAIVKFSATSPNNDNVSHMGFPATISKRFKEMYEWCESCLSKDAWYVNYSYFSPPQFGSKTHIYRESKCTFMFKDASQFMLFKLRWHE